MDAQAGIGVRDASHTKADHFKTGRAKLLLSLRVLGLAEASPSYPEPTAHARQCDRSRPSIFSRRSICGAKVSLSIRRVSDAICGRSSEV